MALRKAAVASTIDVGLPIALQRPITTTATLARPVLMTVEQLKDDTQVVKQFNALQTEVHLVSLETRSHPEQAPVTFKNVACGTAGTKVTLQHNFGRNADFMVVKWKGVSTVVGPSLVCDEDDASAVLTTKDMLALRSYVAGVATIRIWPGV